MDDPTPDPPPRPPTDWTKVALAAIGFATLVVNLNCNHEATRERQVNNEKKIDAVAAKTDDAANKVVEAKTVLATKTAATDAKMDAKLDDIKKTVAALPPAVASEVQKSKGK